MGVVMGVVGVGMIVLVPVGRVGGWVEEIEAV